MILIFANAILMLRNYFKTKI